jgi:error-prone DNA polymerase
MYAELHCHSYYSFHDGASSLEELLLRAKELGYQALALTDHNNLCGAMRFAQLTRSLEMHGVIGVEITLRGDTHLTLLAKDRQGYRNLCHLITAAHNSGERETPELPPDLLAEHATGLIALSGCSQGELSRSVAKSHFSESRNLIKQYKDWFGQDNYYLELQQNMAPGDTQRNRSLFALAK